MIRLIVIGGSAAVLITIGIIAVIPKSAVTSTEPPQLQTVGLPEHGVVLVGPQDPAFSELIAGHSLDPAMTMPAGSALFVVNQAAQSIAACMLKWELLLPDGRIVTHVKSQRSSLETVSDAGSVRLVEVIPANDRLLVSLVGSSRGPGRQFRMGRTQDVSRQFADSVRTRVSIDGVLFVDGTFVGPDTKNYFAQLRGEIEATGDLNAEILRLTESGAAPAAIMNLLQARAKTEGSFTPNRVGGGEHVVEEQTRYSFWKSLRKKQYANSLLLMRKTKGDMSVVEHARAQMGKPRINIRKL